MKSCLIWIRLKLPEKEMTLLQREFGGRIRFERWDDRTAEPPWLAEVNGIFASLEIPESQVSRMPNLKWIHCTRGGVYSFLTRSIVERPIDVTTSSGIHGTPFSEVALSLMLCLATKLPRCWEEQRRKNWNVGIGAEEIHGKTLGIVGLGIIGKELARKAKALGLRVIATRRTVTDKPPGVDELGPPAYLPKLLSESDFVVVCLPTVPTTDNILGEKELRSMKRSAYLVNLVAGGAVEVNALGRAVREGWIAGAALNATPEQPLSACSGIWDLPNVIVTPRLGSSGHKWDKVLPIFRENLERFLSNRPLRNLIDKELGY